RSQLNRRISLDFATFLSYNDGLVTNEPGAPAFSMGPAGPFISIPLTTQNLAHARNYGVETFANWQATSRWKVSPGFSVLRGAVTLNPGGQDIAALRTPGNSPKHQVEVRSMLNLRRNIEWDTSLKYVAGLTSQDVPGSLRVDIRFGWHIGEFAEISVSGQNLGRSRHFEFLDNAGLFQASQIARSLSARLTWRY
ncbi:MAG TPA: hypothetical protein VNH18_03755, partial [Bryobacteraceae bacterium]|nr:hypothetical protein [Bryobacteraceae bacterium]